MSGNLLELRRPYPVISWPWLSLATAPKFCLNSICNRKQAKWLWWSLQKLKRIELLKWLTYAFRDSLACILNTVLDGLSFSHGASNDVYLFGSHAHTQITAIISIVLRFTGFRWIIVAESAILIRWKSRVSIVFRTHDFRVVEDLRVDNLIDGETLHLVQIFAHSIIMVTLKQVLQGDKWFASVSARLWEINRFCEAVSTVSCSCWPATGLIW